MSKAYSIHNQDAVYFTTMSIVNWIDLFTRRVYKDIVVDSLSYCHENKGLVIHAWCIMTNHIHLIIGRKGEFRLEDIIRDFKKYTSVSLRREIERNIQESRKEWMLELFRENANNSKKHEKSMVWQEGYHAIELINSKITEEKLTYLHNNPVKAGFVCDAEHYVYSSAIDYAGGKGLLDVFVIS